MDTRSYKRKDRLTANVGNRIDDLVVRPERCLSSLILRRIRDCPEDAKKIIATYFANRVYNWYCGYIKFGKMNLRIHTKDNGIVIVIKHEW